jgi:hypothetical protein
LAPITAAAERLAKLAGGVAIIRVGGSTEVEVKEKKDRVEDALHSTRAAVEEGIVPGGGVALLRAKAAVKALKSENDDVQAGINIVLKALEPPIRQGASGLLLAGDLVEEAQGGAIEVAIGVRLLFLLGVRTRGRWFDSGLVRHAASSETAFSARSWILPPPFNPLLLSRRHRFILPEAWCGGRGLGSRSVIGSANPLPSGHD